MTGSDPGTAYRAGLYAFTVESHVLDPDDVIPRLMSVFGTAVGPASDDARYVIAGDPDRADTYRLIAHDEPIDEVTALGTIVDWVIADVTRRGVASLDGGPALHAGAVALDEAGVILAGASGAGKSTLTAALVTAGAAYLSDEVAVIDPAARTVAPFPRPLVLDPESIVAIDGLQERLPPAGEGFRLMRYHVTPQDLGSTIATGPVPLALVVAPRFVKGAVTTVEPLSRGELLVVLASHVFGTIDAVETALRELKDVAMTVPGFRVSGGDVVRARAEVQRLLMEARGA